MQKTGKGDMCVSASARSRFPSVATFLHAGPWPITRSQWETMYASMRLSDSLRILMMRDSVIAAPHADVWREYISPNMGWHGWCRRNAVSMGRRAPVRVDAAVAVEDSDIWRGGWCCRSWRRLRGIQSW